MTKRKHKPERDDADDVRDKYDGASDEGSDGGDGGGEGSDGDGGGSTFFTDSEEAPEVLEESLRGKEPDEVEALSRQARELAEEIEEAQVNVARKEYLTEEVSVDALHEEDVDAGEEDEDGLEEEIRSLESRVGEIEEMVGEEEAEEVRRAAERAEAAEDGPVLSLSDYRFETTRYFSLLEERFSDFGLSFELPDGSVEMEPDDWSVSRSDEDGTFVAEADSGRWRSKESVKVQVQTHPEPDEFEGGTAVVGYDTDLGDSVTRFLRSDRPEDYFVLVIATLVEPSELPDEALERVRSAVDARKSIFVVGLEGAEVIYNEDDETAAEVSRKEILNPDTHEAEVSRVSSALGDEMVSGDEMPAEEAADEFGVSEKVAVKSFSEVAESEEEFSVLTQNVSEPILVRW
jgi:hypothetical protein